MRAELQYLSAARPHCVQTVRLSRSVMTATHTFRISAPATSYLSTALTGGDAWLRSTTTPFPVTSPHSDHFAALSRGHDPNPCNGRIDSAWLLLPIGHGRLLGVRLRHRIR